jgi:hypothetical protein
MGGSAIVVRDAWTRREIIERTGANRELLAQAQTFGLDLDEAEQGTVWSWRQIRPEESPAEFLERQADQVLGLDVYPARSTGPDKTDVPHADAARDQVRAFYTWSKVQAIATRAGVHDIASYFTKTAPVIAPEIVAGQRLWRRDQIDTWTTQEAARRDADRRSTLTPEAADHLTALAARQGDVIVTAGDRARRREALTQILDADDAAVEATKKARDVAAWRAASAGASNYRIAKTLGMVATSVPAMIARGEAAAREEEDSDA